MSEPVTTLLDTTLLSNFAHARRPDLLLSVLGLAATTPQVMAELRKGEALGFVPTCDWSWLPVWVSTEAEARTATAWARQLDPGEAECLAVAQGRGCRFLSDDLAARRLAESLGLVVSGTLGVLLKAVEIGVLGVGPADDLLHVMIGRGYRAPVRSLREIAGALGQQSG
jgi:predicted nucleic acid-binding protein